MWVVHERMAELWQLSKQRSLNKEEQTELFHCMDANLNKCRKVAALKNLSLVASMTKDHDWLHEICKQLDEVYVEMKI
jgi:hypothetical protein